MTSGKLGRPAASAAASTSFFERIFDPRTGDLRIARRGPFWDAVLTASRTSVGAGRLVAVIDYGFDLDIHAVRRDLHPSSVTSEATVEPSGHHGSVIALLIRAVAPEAQLLLLDAYSLADGGFPAAAVADAITTARSVGADVINLSCEFETDCDVRDTSWIEAGILADPAPEPGAYLAHVDRCVANAEPYAHARCSTICEVCAAITALPESMLVVAAAGNFGTPACPACVRSVVGVGFQRSHRVESNGVVVTVNEAPRSMDGMLRYELLVDEPEGIDGTSYAAPLASGFAALLPDPAALATMARLTWALTPVTILAGHQAQADPTKLPPGAPSTLHQGLIRIADAFPRAHRHFDEAMTTEPCGICSLLLVPWYQTFVSMLIATSAPHHALPIARIGAVLAPDSAPIWGNLGLAARRVAAAQEDAAERSQLLAEADMAYASATRLDPTVTIYRQALADIRVAASDDSTIAS